MGLKKLFKKFKKEKEVIAGEATKDKVYSSDQSFPTREEAVREFQRSVEKLFDVNRWSNMPGITSTFQMYDANGVEKHAAKPQANDFIKIILPGPTPENWVMVTNLEENEESAEFIVSPSINPTEKEENQDEIAHFFIAEATSTFKVLLEGNQISAYEIGRNEGINNNDEDAGNRKLINTLIAEGGWAGMQDFQWNKLTDYLVHKTEIDG